MRRRDDGRDLGRALEREPVDLGALAEGAVGDARAVEPDRPIDVDAAGDTVVIGDTARLRQVVVNLLGNVRAHTRPAPPRPCGWSASATPSNWK